MVFILKIMKEKLVLIFILFLFTLQGCDKIGAGSYQYAQIYSLGYSRDKVITAIQTFKSQNPIICPPDTLEFKDGYKKDTNGNDITIWYYVFYYYPEQGIYVITFIRDDSAIGLVSIRKTIGGNIQTAQLINHDIPGSENDSIKNEFVTRILNPVKRILAGQ